MNCCWGVASDGCLWVLDTVAPSRVATVCRKRGRHRLRGHAVLARQAVLRKRALLVLQRRMAGLTKV